MSEYRSVREKMRLVHIGNDYAARVQKKEEFLAKNNGINTCHNCHFLVLKNKCRKKNKYLLTLHKICEHHELKRTPPPKDI